MEGNLIPLHDLTYILSSEFPADSKKISDLRIKIEAVRIEMDEYLGVVEYMEKMQQQKIIMSN